MAHLIDTHALVWAALGDRRLSQTAAETLTDPHADLIVSAATACEFADLNRRGRFEVDLPLRPILDRLKAVVIDLPAACWSLMDGLPRLHRDPVDRMLIAHAMHEDHILITSDATIQKYPVRWLW